MAVHVHTSNRSERLVARLAQVLGAPPADPLASDVVVVHGRGLERWLQHELARRLGVCAHVAFPFPDELLADLRAAVLGPDSAGWTRRRLTGALLDALPELDEEPVRGWLAAGGTDRRRVELAHALAARFDRYAALRPELAGTWATAGSGGWQGTLWRGLCERLGPDPATTDHELERALLEAPSLEGVPGRLVFFAVGALPPAVCRVLGALGRHREVHLLLLAPTLTSDEPKHPLLASCGALTRTLRSAAEGLAVPVATFDDPGADTVLHALQSDLLHDRVTTRVFGDDGSVRIHACPGARRQVEVLRDELLLLLDTVPGLEPRDILVSTPDIERWATLVRAIFGDGAEDWHRRGDHPGGLPRIPFRVADRGAKGDNAVAVALLRILGMAGSRLPASEVLDLAALPAVQARFGFGPDDLGTFRRWLAESGIRWGRDAAHRAAEGQPPDGGYTWRFGLDRLLLGQATSGDDPVLGVAPLGGLEGRDTRALLGAFVDLAETLLGELVELEGRRTLEAWRDRLLVLLDRCLADPERWQLRAVQRVLGELAELGDRPLDRDGVQAWLERRFARPDPGSGFLAGGVTFCQLVPLRSIPFRVVVLLGMDDGAFPRIEAGLASDLVLAEPRPGDRTSREDDRSLFLESVLSARDHLVVLYTAIDPTDGRPRPPCVPVAELLDALAPLTRDVRAFVRRHPLAPWSSGPEPTHDRRQLHHAAARGARSERPPFLDAPLSAVDPPAELSLATLERFYKAPIRALCQGRLNLWFPAEDPEVRDREPMGLDALEAWGLKDELLRRTLRGDAEPWAWASAAGKLPLGSPGVEALDVARREVEGILEAAADDLARPAERVLVEVELGPTRIHGRIVLRGDRVVKVQASRAGGPHVFSAWLVHLLANAGHGPVGTHLVGSGGRSVELRPLTRTEARAHLEGLLAVHALGQRYPLLWFPDAAWSHAGGQRVGWPGWSEPDAYAELFLRGRDPFAEGEPLDGLPVPVGSTARELAVRLWSPVRAAMEAP